MASPQAQSLSPDSLTGGLNQIFPNLDPSPTTIAAVFAVLGLSGLLLYNLPQRLKSSPKPSLKKSALSSPSITPPSTPISKEPHLDDSQGRGRTGSFYDASPITNRTAAEIAAFGRFPNYTKLCGEGARLPVEYPEFVIEKAMPRPYRPFRWAYHQTMSLSKMEWDWWLELESTYTSRITQRKSLFVLHGNKVLDMQPCMLPACQELLEMVLQFLCARYPHYFSLYTSDASPDGRPDIFQNGILGTETNLIEMRHRPLEVLLDHIPEDFLLTKRNEETGKYELRAGVACSSIGWDVQSKIGKDLMAIHEPIPDYKEKMARSMDRFFSKMPSSSPIQRGSWGLEYGQPLFFFHNDPCLSSRESQNPNLTIDDIYLRVDWQTLRRLPLSGSIVFNFKALFTPVSEFRNEPRMPGIVLKALKEGKKSLMDYKGTWHVQHVVEGKLEEWDKEQREKGMMGREEEVATDEEYPYFKGWQGKWRGQQGF